MKIAIFGLGYVGMTAAACLAQDGHEIIGVDVNDEKVATVNAGKSPIAEPGLDDLIETAVRSSRLRATHDASTHLNSCAMAIVCVGTPSASDGSHNMGFIAEVTRQIAGMVTSARAEPLTVVYRSTVRPGTIEELIYPIFEQKLKADIDKIEVVYNPEFLRETAAIEDFYNPPKIVIGTRDGQHSKNLDILNAKLTAPVFYTQYREAEMTKFVDNTFHALKVAFANEIGRVCNKLGVNTQKIHEIFVSDTKLNISKRYLQPGGAFGGSCLPKDVRALQYMASDLGAHTHLINALILSNETHKHFLFDACTKNLKPGSDVLQIGLAFKAESDDLRESPNIDMARKFLQAGFKLSIYDPHVHQAKLIGQNLGYAFSNLPGLQALLISKEEMESRTFDLIVDTRGWAKQFSLRSNRIFNLNALL